MATPTGPAQPQTRPVLCPRGHSQPGFQTTGAVLTEPNPGARGLGPLCPPQTPAPHPLGPDLELSFTPEGSPGACGPSELPFLPSVAKRVEGMGSGSHGAAGHVASVSTIGREEGKEAKEEEAPPCEMKY